MRIVILSIALLFCAFSAHSQVLKSAGVWYFLDVDSLNNRPAQLPNGTELAYVVGTKKIYYWNRTTSTWTEYGAGGGGLTMPFDSIYFNPTTADPDTAELKYNADLETFVFGADGTVIEIGQKSAWYVKNQTGSTITKGTVVRASGTLGSSGRILISPMVIDGTVDSKYLLGITASDIADGSDGYVIHFGKLRKFNTSSWSDGAALYAGTGGTLTATEPSPPNLRLPIAFVVHSHATNGILAIRIQTGNELHELHDVDTTGIDNGGVIVWNGTKWEASDGTAITTADTTSLLATKYWTNSNFFPLQGGTLTGTGGAGFVGLPHQTTLPTTPSNGIRIYGNGNALGWVGSDGYERQFASTLTGGCTYTLPNANGTFALGTGTATRIPIWTSTNSLGDSPILYNSTTKRTTWDSPGVIELPMGTNAQRPTATTSDFWYNTTGNGIEWYNGTRWAKGLESTFNRGTSTYIPFFDANGQITESVNYQVKTSSGQFLAKRGSGSTPVPSYSFQSDDDTGVAGSADGVAMIHDGVKVADFRSNVINFYKNIAIYNTPDLGTWNSYFSYIYTRNVAALKGTAAIPSYVFQDGSGNIITAGMYATGTQANNGLGFSTKATAEANSTSKLFINPDGKIAIGPSFVTPSYSLHVTGTDAIGIPRGPVSSRPTWVTATTPLRFNTDSSAIEYATALGTWNLVATRAYARLLAAGSTWLKPQLEAGNVTINALSNADFIINNLDTIKFGNVLIRGRSNSLLFINPNVGSSGTVMEGGGYHTNLNGTISGSHGGTGHIVLGGVVTANSSGAVFNEAIGYTTATNGAYASAFVYGATATGDNTLAIGRSAVADENNEISLGSSIYTKINLWTNSGDIYAKGDVIAEDSVKVTTRPSMTSNQLAVYDANGWLGTKEQKRDTTVYIEDTDLDWSSVITTAQISSRYNRVFFLMTTTGAAGSNSDLTLHTPDVNLMQVEYLIRSTDEAGGFTNTIQFGSNNAVQSDNTLTGTYTPAAGQGVGIRAGLRSGTYKYWYY